MVALSSGAAESDEVPDAYWMTQPVPGFLVSLSVQAQPPVGAKGRERHAGDLPHRLRIEISPDQPPDTAEVSGLSLYIAEEGYVGSTVAPQRSGLVRKVQYEANAVLRPAMNYRILVRFDPPDGSRAREALFIYRHHH